jgi:hypothetical protein
MKHASVLLLALLTLAPAPAFALPKMEVSAAKAALYSRQPTPTAREFNQRRIVDLPSFDKIGIGNYHAEYRLDNGKKLMVWMYVESEPPLVDEVVLYVTPANTKDTTHARAIQLVDLVYRESNAGSYVIDDFKKAKKSPIPMSYDGGMYFLGDIFGYKVSYNRGGLEVGIYRLDHFKLLVKDIENRVVPKPAPTPKPTPKPTPVPTPIPKVKW